MKKLSLILVLLAAPLPAVAASPSPTAAPLPVPAAGELWINEFLPNPAGVDTGNEWVELKNVGDKALDVGGVKVKRQSGTTVATVPGNTVVPAGGLFLMNASGSLVNGGDTLELWAGTVLLDRVTYDTAEDGLSWVRLGTDEGAWSDQPTPGGENPSEVTSGDTGGDNGGADGSGAAASPTSASTRSAATPGTGTVPRRTASVSAKRGPLPQSGVGAWAYVLPTLLATLYAYKTRDGR